MANIWQILVKTLLRKQNHSLPVSISHEMAGGHNSEVTGLEMSDFLICYRSVFIWVDKSTFLRSGHPCSVCSTSQPLLKADLHPHSVHISSTTTYLLGGQVRGKYFSITNFSEEDFKTKMKGRWKTSIKWFWICILQRKIWFHFYPSHYFTIQNWNYLSFY